MNREILTIPNMMCGHCEMRITKELSAMDGVDGVQADSGAKKLNVSFDQSLTVADITAALERIGYPAGETLA